MTQSSVDIYELNSFRVLQPSCLFFFPLSLSLSSIDTGKLHIAHTFDTQGQKFAPLLGPTFKRPSEFKSLLIKLLENISSCLSLLGVSSNHYKCHLWAWSFRRFCFSVPMRSVNLANSSKFIHRFCLRCILELHVTSWVLYYTRQWNEVWLLAGVQMFLYLLMDGRSGWNCLWLGWEESLMMLRALRGHLWWRWGSVAGSRISRRFQTTPWRSWSGCSWWCSDRNSVRSAETDEL